MEVVCATLKRNGYKVLTAENGLEAMEALRKRDQEIHLVITDVVMPSMGGAELAAECDRLGIRTKFLFQSGYTEDRLIESGIRSGQIHFIEKPYGNKTLLAKVREVLG
jgi:two-component system cell cycle sensor histidine kinase/response regulator CckA